MQEALVRAFLEIKRAFDNTPPHIDIEAMN